MQRDEMERLILGVEIKAEKIRLLHDAGASRAEIRDFLGISYQHVHNVLKRCNRLESAGDKPPTVTDAVFQVRVEKGGRIVLPPAYVEAQGINDGDTLISRDEGGNLVIMSRAAAIAAIQETARRRMPEEAALLDALIGAPIRN